MDLNKQLYRSDTNKFYLAFAAALASTLILIQPLSDCSGLYSPVQERVDRLSDRSTDHAVKTGWSILNQQKSFV